MASLARISKIQQRWADRATFLTIYIQGNYNYFDMYCKSINIASRYSIFVYFQKPMQRRRRSLKIHYSRLKLTRVLVKDWRQRVRMTNDVFTFHCATELHRLTAGELQRAEALPGPLLVDNMRDEASTAYGALPERLYIVLDRKIVYQADDVFRYTGYYQ